MRISELSAASGLPIPTLKYYLRAGLLPRGEATAPNQARYTHEHVRRLRLIRALTTIGRLDLAAVKRVLSAIDDPRLPLHEVLGVAQQALSSPLAGADDGEAAGVREEVDRFIDDELGWRISETAPARRTLVDALLTLRGLGRNVDVSSFEPYARAAHQVAKREVGRVADASSREELVEGAVVGTVVYEAVLTALRRLAHEHESALRFGRRDIAEDENGSDRRERRSRTPTAGEDDS